MGKIKEEGGLTLVEVLAALVILSIVFIGFMMIFPQMTNFNALTETKLTTMNIARQEIVDIQSKSKSFSAPLNLADILNKIPGSTEFISQPSDQPTPNVIEISYKKGAYDYRAEFFEVPDLSNVDSAGVSFAGNKLLYKVHLKVMVEGRVNSETYGYIEIAG